MAKCETVKIKRFDRPGSFTIINVTDFNENVHELYDEEEIAEGPQEESLPEPEVEEVVKEKEESGFIMDPKVDHAATTEDLVGIDAKRSYLTKVASDLGLELDKRFGIERILKEIEKAEEAE